MMTHGWAFPDADTFMRQELRPDGSYQRDHLDAALRFVTDFTMAVDGGAHIGTWSRILSGRFETVVAVEPSEDTFAALTVNMAMFQCVNVLCRHAALGAQSGFGSMALDSREAARQNTGARYVTTGDDVHVVALDDWQLPSLGFLKLDVEGSEPFALRGAMQTLKRCKPIVLFEDKRLWTRYGEPRRAPHDVLASCGYRHLATAGCDQIWGPA